MTKKLTALLAQLFFFSFLAITPLHNPQKLRKPTKIGAKSAKVAPKNMKTKFEKN